MKTFPLYLFVLTIHLTLSACATQQPLTKYNSSLTHGNVQMHINVGETTKAEILEEFGSPNVTTRDSKGQEVWTYQRQAQISQSSGRSSAGGGSFFIGSSQSSGFESSSRMMTLIIKFDHNDVISDFRSRASNF